ncbi:hypothetical protein [Tropicimonas marinistellae]|uniref:hypothetical protein n=1 Tax=Tropicimonas marinistellae TaxID=1739787 RepID=UPI0013729322|nr:hypothetical protein [Tropicimonas marinistellae]
MKVFTTKARHPNPADVIGPYSLWPQARSNRNWKKPATVAAGIAAAGIFVHCAVPLMA